MSKATDLFPHEDIPALNAFYGDPSGKNGLVSPKWYSENIVRWYPPYQMYFVDKTPLKTLLIHKLCLATFDEAFNEILNHYGEDKIKEHRLNVCGGTYNYRLMRGSSRLSTHAYGIAIDMDPAHNPYPHIWTSDGLDKDFISIMENAGFWWRGADNDIDPMHFQCTWRRTKSVPVVKAKADGVLDAPTRVYNFYVTNGLTPAQACGIVANIEAESSFDIRAIGDGGHAHGLFQMHLNRRKDILAATGVNMSSDDIEAQCKGALWEMHNSELVAYGKIKAAETAFAAGYAVCRYYERPASHLEWIERGHSAEKWFQHFQNAPETIQETPVVDTPPLATEADTPDTPASKEVKQALKDIEEHK